VFRRPFIVPGASSRAAFSAFPRLSLDPRGNTRPRRPRAARLPARHAHACHAPSGSAAGASRHSTRIARLPCHALSLSPQLLNLGLERGMFRGLGCASARRFRHRPPLWHTGLTALSLAALRPAPSARAPTALRLRREASPHQCPARSSGPLPSVHSPLHLSNSAPSVQRVACLPNRLARPRRG
jgi:hypothetical protein